MEFIYSSLRLILYPILNYLLPVLIPAIKDRIVFEKTPVLGKGKNIEFSFEVSSEGELEQIKPPLLNLLKLKRSVEVLYCSPSVKKKCESLFQNYQDNLTLRPVQLIRYFPFGKFKKYALPQGEQFILCRYDFFPELIFFGAKKAKKFYLLSGAVSTFEVKPLIVKKYLSWCYSLFDMIICATKYDYEKFIDLRLSEREKLDIFDFRTLAILERLNTRKKTLNDKFPLFPLLHEKLKDEPSIIFGSFWANEKEMIKKDLINHFNIFIAPHNLNEEEINDIFKYCKSLEGNVFIIDEKTSPEVFLDKIKADEKSIFILNIKGVLCEMYPFFPLAYIGGGFGKSIHSVLEPFLAGCHVFYGPKNKRSSEKIYIEEVDPKRSHEVSNIDEFYSLISQTSSKKISFGAGTYEKLHLEYDRILVSLKWN